MLKEIEVKQKVFENKIAQHCAELFGFYRGIKENAFSCYSNTVELCNLTTNISHSTKDGRKFDINYHSKDAAKHLANVMPNLLVNNRCDSNEISDLEREQIKFFMIQSIREKLEEMVHVDQIEENIAHCTRSDSFIEALDKIHQHISDINESQTSYTRLKEYVNNARVTEDLIEKTCQNHDKEMDNKIDELKGLNVDKKTVSAVEVISKVQESVTVEVGKLAKKDETVVKVKQVVDEEKKAEDKAMKAEDIVQKQKTEIIKDCTAHNAQSAKAGLESTQLFRDVKQNKRATLSRNASAFSLPEECNTSSADQSDQHVSPSNNRRK